MDLVDVDVVGAQAAQRIFDLLQDASARRIAIDFSVAPFQSRLGGDDRLTSHARERGADDFLGHPEAVHRCGIDQVDALMQSGVNGGNRFALIGSSPHPAAHGPCTERHSGDLEFGLGNIEEFSFAGRDLGLD